MVKRYSRKKKKKPLEAFFNIATYWHSIFCIYSRKC
mgnify:CR=1